MVKNPPAKQKMQIRSLGPEYPLAKEMATHFTPGKLAWEISWTEELVGYRPWGLKRVRHDLVTEQNQI